MGTKRKASELENASKPVKKEGQTLYVRNLDTKISINDLRINLYMLFSTYGRICALNASKSPKCRGQAYVGFDNPKSAALALNKLQGVLFLGKEISIEYAKTESLRVQWNKGEF